MCSRRLIAMLARLPPRRLLTGGISLAAMPATSAAVVLASRRRTAAVPAGPARTRLGRTREEPRRPRRHPSSGARAHRGRIRRGRIRGPARRDRARCSRARCSRIRRNGICRKSARGESCCGICRVRRRSGTGRGPISRRRPPHGSQVALPRTRAPASTSAGGSCLRRRGTGTTAVSTGLTVRSERMTARSLGPSTGPGRLTALAQTGTATRRPRSEAAALPVATTAACRGRRQYRCPVPAGCLAGRTTEGCCRAACSARRVRDRRCRRALIPVRGRQRAGQVTDLARPPGTTSPGSSCRRPAGRPALSLTRRVSVASALPGDRRQAGTAGSCPMTGVTRCRKAGTRQVFTPAAPGSPIGRPGHRRHRVLIPSPTSPASGMNSRRTRTRAACGGLRPNAPTTCHGPVTWLRCHRRQPAVPDPGHRRQRRCR